MRAKYVFEKFTEKGDAIKDMGIGLSYPQQLMETAMQLFGDKVMFRYMTAKESWHLKGIPPYYHFDGALVLTTKEWSELRKALGKPISKNYTASRRVPHEGRNEKCLTVANVLDDIYKGNFFFVEQGSKTLVINDVNIIFEIDKIGYTFGEFWNEIKEYYAR